MNCIHGIDARFCAACNRGAAQRARSAVGQCSLEEILRFVSDQHVRVTYGAVAEVLGVNPRAIGGVLGPRRPEASWIVNAGTGLPTDYSEDEWDPALLSQAEIISSGRALILRIAAWRGARRNG